MHLPHGEQMKRPKPPDEERFDIKEYRFKQILDSLKLFDVAINEAHAQHFFLSGFEAGEGYGRTNTTTATPEPSTPYFSILLVLVACSFLSGVFSALLERLW